MPRRNRTKTLILTNIQKKYLEIIRWIKSIHQSSSYKFYAILLKALTTYVYALSKSKIIYNLKRRLIATINNANKTAIQKIRHNKKNRSPFFESLKLIKLNPMIIALRCE